MKKKLKPVDIFIQNFVNAQKDYYYAMIREIKAIRKAKLKPNKA